MEKCIQISKQDGETVLQAAENVAIDQLNLPVSKFLEDARLLDEETLLTVIPPDVQMSHSAELCAILRRIHVEGMHEVEEGL